MVRCWYLVRLTKVLWAAGLLLRAVNEPRLIGSEVGVRLIGVTIAFSGFLKAILGVRLMYTRDSTTQDYGMYSLCQPNNTCYRFICLGARKITMKEGSNFDVIDIKIE